MFVDVQVLIAENRTKRKTAQCSAPRIGIDNRMRQRQQPCRVQRISRAPVFFLGKLRTYHMRYIHSLVDVLVRTRFVYFSNHVGGAKRTVKPSKKEQPTAAAQTSGVHNDQHRAVGTPHSTLCSSDDFRSLYAAVYLNAFLRIRLTHSAVVSKAYVKRCNLNEITTPAETDTKMSSCQQSMHRTKERRERF